jgi:sucrose-6-phosphate hydrolase SacC (GH32 family)
MWECPQLFPLEDRWVLIVSVWHGDGLHQVAASVGSYDGRRFEPGPWQQVTHGTSAYATAAFADRDGRRCLLSWLRVEPAYDAAVTDQVTDWAGAHSVVSTVRLSPEGALVLRPHPQLAALRGAPLAGRPDAEGERYELGDAPVELTLQPRAGVVDTTVLWAADGAVATFVVNGSHGLRVERPGLPDEHLPPGDPTEPVTVLLDADIVEVFNGGYGAYWLPPSAPPVTRLLTSGGPCTVRHLTAGA